MNPNKNSNQQTKAIPAKTKVPLGSRKILKAKSKVAPMNKNVKTLIRMTGVKGAFLSIWKKVLFLRG